MGCTRRGGSPVVALVSNLVPPCVRWGGLVGLSRTVVVGGGGIVGSIDIPVSLVLFG